MDAADLELRRRTYAFFVEHGRAPTASEFGDADEFVAGWRRLHAEHAVVLNLLFHCLVPAARWWDDIVFT